MYNKKCSSIYEESQRCFESCNFEFFLINIFCPIVYVNSIQTREFIFCFKLQNTIMSSCKKNHNDPQIFLIPNLTIHYEQNKFQKSGKLLPIWFTIQVAISILYIYVVSTQICTYITCQYQEIEVKGRPSCFHLKVYNNKTSICIIQAPQSVSYKS